MNIHLIQPDAYTYTQWNQSDIREVVHKPNGVLHPRSSGEGYHFIVTEQYIAEELAKCFAGFLQVRDREAGLRYGVLRVTPGEGASKLAIHPFHIVKYQSVLDEREVRNPLGKLEKQKVEIGHEGGGWIDFYVVEGEKSGREYIAEMQRQSLSVLLHEGAHPHRGDLPHFIKWLESVEAIPPIRVI